MIFDEQKIYKVFKKRVFSLFIMLGFSAIVLISLIDYFTFQKNIKILLQGQAKDFALTFSFILEKQGKSGAQNFIGSLYEAEKELQLVLYYSFTEKRFTISSNPEYLGRTLGEIGNKKVQMELENSINSQTSDVIHKEERLYRYLDKQKNGILIIHISDEHLFDQFFLSSLFSQLILIVFVFILSIVPLILIFRRVLAPFQEKINEFKRKSPTYIGKFRGNLEPAGTSKKGVFSLMKQLTQDLDEVHDYELWKDSLLEKFPAGILFVNKNEEVIHANEKSGELLGILPESLQGNMWIDTILPDDREVVKETWYKSIKEQTFVDIACRIRTSDGLVNWVYAFFSPLRDLQDQVIGFLVVLNPINKLKNEEKNNEAVRNLLEATKNLTFNIDLFGKIVSWSPGAESTFGKRKEEAMNQCFYDWIDPEQKKLMTDLVHQIVSGANEQKTTLKYHNPKGEQVELKLQMLAIKDGSGQTVEISIIGEDHNKSESIESRGALLDMKEANLISLISHQLRTPLSVIQGAIEIINKEIKGKIPEEHFEYISICRNNLQKVIQMIHDTLNYEQLEFGLKIWDIKEVDIFNLLKKCASYYETKFKEKGIDFQQEIPDSLPKAFVDEKSMETVIENLLSNAFTFTEKGSVKLRAFEKDGQMTIEVEDTGLGIREEDQKSLFQIFSQIHSSNLKYGSGLGLVIVKKVIEHYKGNVSFKSEFQKGSTFSVTFPIRST